MINPLHPRLLPDPSGLRWPTVNSGCAHTDPLASITITRSATRYLKRTQSSRTHAPPRHRRLPLLPWLPLLPRLPRLPRLSLFPRLPGFLRIPGFPRLHGPRAALAVLLALTLLTMAAVSTATASPAPPDTAPVPPGFAGPAARFAWPLPAPHPVLRPFQAPATPYGAGHRGVDLGGSVGEPVFAAGDGLVLYAGALFNCDLISIEHPGGLRTTYTPVVPSVRVGQQVTRRQQIGTLLAARPGCPEEVGNDGTGPPVFLYWGVHRDRDYLDPLRLVATGEVRLLPWPGDDQ
jgi:hypothetical protein